ncbi:MAG TPA: hypothetical protein VN811_00060 [Thermoanaerobaculia bacterium]|nr:hypothetical protein [Thermoanaerobaculia bacterium]
MERARPLPPRRRRLLADVALALLLLWAGGTFLFEAHGAYHDWRAGALHHPTPFWWRLGSRPSQRWRRCLTSVDALLGAREPVLLWDPGNDFDRWRWAAYFLPHRDVVQAGPQTPSGSVVVASSRSAPPGARRVAGESWCGLYRLP